VTSDNPCVRGLVDRASRTLADDASPLERARAMERFVNRYVSDKSLGVGFATAAEVCATREGDCSEHAVLLAAMLRADGIPSRTVSGLVYVDQFRAAERVFGFHMWTQALLEVDGAMRWVDLDAAVMPMDATHIAISTSSLSESDVVNSMVSVATMLTGLSISVEAVE
jgi:transglutaminase-like putative cysteine protease